MNRTFGILALLAAGVTPTAYGIDFHGYFRSGIGASQGGSDQMCFSNPNSTFGKYRLGNECDTYIELSLGQEIKQKEASENDLYFKTNVMLAFASAGHRGGESSDAMQDDTTKALLGSDLSTSLPEVYAQAINVFKPGIKVWVGKRYYQRHDIHILDFFYLADTGPGAGVEDIDIGAGKLHFAVLRNVPGGKNAVGPVQTNFDLRVSGIKVGSGTLQPVLIYANSGERDSQTGKKSFETMSGWQLSVLHNQPEILGGDNTFAVQYGAGLFGGRGDTRASNLDSFGSSGTQNVAKGDNATKDAINKSNSLRVLDQLIINPNNNVSAAFVAVWQRTDFGNAKTDSGATEVKDKTEMTVGTRPVYHFGNNVDLAFEYGYTNTQKAIANTDGTQTTYKDAELHKFTLAPQISPAGFFGRPQLRLFATYAKWNEANKGKVGGAVYDEAKSGFSTGAQVEAWW